MKLDRTTNGNGLGKYALIKWRNYKPDLDIDSALRTLEAAGMIDIGNMPQTEFFVIRLKDINAPAALQAYAHAAHQRDPEFSADVMELARRAALHPDQKDPD